VAAGAGSQICESHLVSHLNLGLERLARTRARLHDLGPRTRHNMAWRAKHVAFVGANGFPAAAYAPTIAALRARGLPAAGHDCFQAMLPSVRAGRCVDL